MSQTGKISGPKMLNMNYHMYIINIPIHIILFFCLLIKKEPCSLVYLEYIGVGIFAYQPDQTSFGQV